jgi:hypothetical protein
MIIMERARSVGLIDASPVAAGGATGLEAGHVSEHRGKRHSGDEGLGHRRQTWPKLTTVLHIHSHLIISAVAGIGSGQASPDFTPALRQVAAAGTLPLPSTWSCSATPSSTPILGEASGFANPHRVLGAGRPEIAAAIAQRAVEHDLQQRRATISRGGA